MLTTSNIFLLLNMVIPFCLQIINKKCNRLGVATHEMLRLYGIANSHLLGRNFGAVHAIFRDLQGLNVKIFPQKVGPRPTESSWNSIHRYPWHKPINNDFKKNSTSELNTCSACLLQHTSTLSAVKMFPIK